MKHRRYAFRGQYGLHAYFEIYEERVKKQAVQRRWSIEKRLEFIDFQLFWDGQINRSDIRDRFGVALLQASKDIAQYQEIAPKNLNYDLREKRYFATNDYKPVLFEPDAEAYLTTMRDDVRKILREDDSDIDLPPHDVVSMPRRIVSAEILRKVISTVKQGKALEVFYQSMSRSEPMWRTISPHAFAFDGMRWHVRAFCHTGGHHKDFLLSRIQKTGKMEDTSHTAASDEIWNEFFTVILKPHPQLTESQAKSVAIDYDMTDHKLNVKVRLALLYYFLRRLGLQDCDGEKLSSREYHVIVANEPETKKALERAQKTFSLDDKRSALLPPEKQGTVPEETLSAQDHEKNNLPDILARWTKREDTEKNRARTEASFCIPKSDIAATGYDLSLGRYKEVKPKDVRYDDPKNILKDLRRIEKDIAEGMKQLEEVLR